MDSLKDIIQRVYQKKVSLALIVVIFIIVGILYSFLIPREYKVSMTLIPESSSNSNISSSLSGLASIAGVELGGVDKQVSISPALYKTIANSYTNLQTLLKI